MVSVKYVDIVLALLAHIWLRNRQPLSLRRSIVPIGLIPGMLAFYSQDPGVSVLNLYFIFIMTLMSSILTYRLSPFHPLAQYPGPLLCKTSKLWAAYIAYRGKLHQYHRMLHAQYGPIVRVGPNELSICDKDFVPHILGSPGLPKGPIWDGRSFSADIDKNKDHRLISMRDPVRRAELRKPWNQAFKGTPMKTYEETLINEVNKFIRLLETTCQMSPDHKGRINLTQWISYLSFDFMGSIAFGESFNLLRDGDKDGIFKNMEKGLFLPSILQHVPWMTRIVHATPFVGGSIKQFAIFAMQQAQRRLAQDVQKHDFFYFMLNALESDSRKDPIPFIFNNAILAIIAGSDTTASALCNVMYYLLRYPSYFKRLRQEIDDAFSFADCALVDISQLPNLKLLNAVVNETLRLQPPLPNSLQRASAPGSPGNMYGKAFIPGGTAVVIPPYSLHRHPSYFSPRPDDFWPDRWLIENDPTIILDLGAFIPFSYGPANCAGKPLAMQELRYITAVLVRQFDISFDPAFEPDSWEEALMDRFVIAKGQLPVVITTRNSE